MSHGVQLDSATSANAQWRVMDGNLLQLILSYAESMHTILNCRRVSRHWQHVTRQPISYSSIAFFVSDYDMQNAHESNRVTAEEIPNHITLTRIQPTKASDDDMHTFTLRVQSFITSFPHPTDVQIMLHHSTDTFLQLFAPHATHLHTLSVEQNERVTDDALIHCISHAKLLRSFDMSGTVLTNKTIMAVG